MKIPRAVGLTTVVAPAFCRGFSLLSSSSSPIARRSSHFDGDAGDGVRRRSCGTLQLVRGEGNDNVNDSGDTASDRRKFLTQSSTAILVAVAGGGGRPQSATAANDDMMTPPRNRKIGGLALKLRAVTHVMDELQRDLMQERWDLVESYPAQLRSFVPVFTTYTDSAFPTDAPTDKGLRVALRYEVGRFFASLERFKQATQRKSLDEAYIAYSEMSLHFDRYLRVGGLYTYYDDMISTEPYFKGITDDSLVYANQRKDPPLVRDLVILIKGPDKGKTGIVIGMYQDGSNKSVIKLDRYKGMREVRVVSNSWVAKRLGEQDPDDVFLIPRPENHKKS